METEAGLRVLFLANDVPCPAVSGIRLRLLHLLRGLAATGDVDAWFMPDAGAAVDTAALASEPLRRFDVFTRPTPRRGPGTTARWLASGRPAEIATARADDIASALRRWITPPYDLAVAVHRLYPLVAPALTGDLVAHRVADFQNLEGDVLRHERRHLTAHPVRRQAVDVVDPGRWDRLERRIAAGVDAVWMCSELDRERLGAANAAVVPNGYELAGPPAGRPAEVGERPVVTMVGTLHYPPNLEAARWFSSQVLPLVAHHLPAVRFRVVGDPGPQGASLAGPRVELRGVVPEVATELATTDVVVAPLRSGGGTRIKVLEAFAHRIPVVATSVGCEGLEVEDGVHLLMGDTPADFARQVVQLLTDLALRRRLSDAAHRLYREEYTWAAVRERVARLAAALASSSSS